MMDLAGIVSDLIQRQRRIERALSAKRGSGQTVVNQTTIVEDPTVVPPFPTIPEPEFFAPANVLTWDYATAAPGDLDVNNHPIATAHAIDCSALGTGGVGAAVFLVIRAWPFQTDSPGGIAFPAPVSGERLEVRALGGSWIRLWDWSIDDLAVAAYAQRPFALAVPVDEDGVFELHRARSVERIEVDVYGWLR